MSLPFLILAGTVAYTIYDGGVDSESSSTTSSSSSTTKTSSSGRGRTSSSSKSSSIVADTNGSSLSMFLYGSFFGIGLSMLVSYQLKRTRLLQRVKLQILSWLYDDVSPFLAWTDGGDSDTAPGSASRTTSDNESDDDDKSHGDTRLVDKFRHPTKLDGLSGTPIQVHPESSAGSDSTNCGTACELVSTDWTLTNGMTVDVVTLAPGAEIVPKTSKGLEFYYVIRGSGDLIRNGMVEKISSGTGFIVDPDHTRGFKARGAMGKLVLLRATDSNDTGTQTDSVSRQSSKLSNAKNMVIAGLGKIQTLVESYGNQETTTTGTVPGRNTLDQ